MPVSDLDNDLGNIPYRIFADSQTAEADASLLSALTWITDTSLVNEAVPMYSEGAAYSARSASFSFSQLLKALISRQSFRHAYSGCTALKEITVYKGVTAIPVEVEITLNLPESEDKIRVNAEKRKYPKGIYRKCGSSVCIR